MKIIVEYQGKKAEINDLLIFKGEKEIEVLVASEVLNAESSFGVPKIAFLFYDLKQNENLTIKTDQELKDLLDSLENDFDEDLIY